MWKPLNAEYNAALVSRFQSLIPQTLEHQFKQQEEARKATEHIFKQQEEARKAWEHIFHEWERLQLKIRELSKALGSEANLLLKRDMEADIVILIYRKNQFTGRLNFT